MGVRGRERGRKVFLTESHHATILPPSQDHRHAGIPSMFRLTLNLNPALLCGSNITDSALLPVPPQSGQLYKLLLFYIISLSYYHLFFFYKNKQIKKGEFKAMTDTLLQLVTFLHALSKNEPIDKGTSVLG